MYNTLLLDPISWDLLVDANGNIAMASPPYSLAQDVASAIKTFLGECWYNTTVGTPYFDNILGQMPPLAYVQGQVVLAALTVSGVVSAKCVIKSFQGRTIVGQCVFIDESGNTQTANF